MFFKGEFLMVNFGTMDCLNLPNQWKNRVSSIFSKKCLILYTQVDCKNDKFKATLIKDKVYFYQHTIASYNFNGSS